MQDFEYLLENEIGVIVLISAGVSFLTLIIAIMLAVRLSSMQKRYRTLLKSKGFENLENRIREWEEALMQVKRRAEEESGELKAVREELTRHKGHMGVVRFNAFDGTGSDLSFSVALLDSRRNGVVITSLYGRNESRVYGKPVENGESPYTLSPEEKEAIEKAQ